MAGREFGWFHDGSAKGLRHVGLGDNWVICAIVVSLPPCSRPVACQCWQG